MKVFIHYEEPAAESLRQTLKITLPKKWEKGPCSNLMDTFVKNYNAKHPENQLNGSQLRIETEMREVVPMHAVAAQHSDKPPHRSSHEGLHPLRRTCCGVPETNAEDHAPEEVGDGPL